MRYLSYIILFQVLYTGICSGQSRFFRQYWVDYNSEINNTNSTGRPERPRVGDRGMSTHPDYWQRTEAQVNGLIMINIPDTIRNIDHAELYLELWGGHPGTAGKKFQINGGSVYLIPDKPTTEDHCEYLYPSIPFDNSELHIRIWDGGEGSIKDPFKINGVSQQITSGKAIHDLVYSNIRIDPKILEQGLNELSLLSDTDHHGIEVCWPGPALVIKYK